MTVTEDHNGVNRETSFSAMKWWFALMPITCKRSRTSEETSDSLIVGARGKEQPDQPAWPKVKTTFARQEGRAKAVTVGALDHDR